MEWQSNQPARLPCFFYFYFFINAQTITKTDERTTFSRRNATQRLQIIGTGDRLLELKSSDRSVTSEGRRGAWQSHQWQPFLVVENQKPMSGQVAGHVRPVRPGWGGRPPARRQTASAPGRSDDASLAGEDLRIPSQRPWRAARPRPRRPPHH